ncbi:hypothetical protein CPB83DRAFT_768181 [Crepidotus variabilis]|uniref:COP9 signalosome complex subunit 3 n=1 Tax=Crepidotus variabilis TaxID=179855 RepID=A0A9P6JPK1_9AGAR|nr:hypothetical protein CPB83DRAFT_768181 [Crepidotus variabilis]
MATNQPIFSDAIINQITTAQTPTTLQNFFKTGVSKEVREALLVSFLSTGQDPLSILDVRTHTLGVLYILSARVSASFGITPPPSWQLVQDFCTNFDREQARLAPERITKLAKGIHRLASHVGNPSLAIPPLQDLISHYPPHPSYLTTIHPIFLLACTSTHNFTSTLPVLSTPITNIDTAALSPDLTYSDNLTYHYLGGIALAALKKWKEAEEYFEICVTSPGTVPAALQMEALKKLRLVQLISCGKISTLPKYTHPQLLRLFKATPYHAFISAYPHNTQQLNDICEKEKITFAQEKNIGLIQQSLVRASRWSLKKLTATYVTLHLSDIAKAVKIDDENEVRALLLSMIESSDIHASISSTGSVTFLDPPPQFTKSDVDAVLQSMQSQTDLLIELDAEVGRGKDFLSKIVKSGGGDPSATWAAVQGEEELLLSGVGMGMGMLAWDE